MWLLWDASGPTAYGPRTIPLVCASATQCVLHDIIDTFGTRAYRIFFDEDDDDDDDDDDEEEDEEEQQQQQQQQGNDKQEAQGPAPPPSSVPAQPCAGNITPGCNAVFNPSFEDCRGMDVPDGIWILSGNDTDAAVLADSRDS
eukprot:COSAG01_NODE_560_length_15462_cov_18.361192_4_plen_143_part_00